MTIALLVLAAYVAVIAGICRFLRNARGPEPDDDWPPEHGHLIAQVIREFVGDVEDMERLANTGELAAIDIALYDPVTDEELAPFEKEFR